MPGAITGRVLQEEEKAAEQEGVPDEEGWVKVTRRGRRPVLPRTEAASLRVLERERRKRARKELLNFYAWQHRETKMERKGTPARASPTDLEPQLPGPGLWVWDPSPQHRVLVPLCSPQAALGSSGLLGAAEAAGVSDPQPDP